MIIIFEDNENTPSSRLLSSCYYGSNIVFSGGASQLSIKIFEKLQEDDVMVFVDVVPNNEYTVSTYRKLKRLYRTEIRDGHLIVVPIICVEYVILKMLSNYGDCITNNIYVQNLVCNFNYRKLINTVDINQIQLHSLEKLLKYALSDVCSKTKQRCLSNSFEYINDSGLLSRKQKSVSGIFYEKDCNCERIYCRLNINDDLKLKAEKLYMSLPVYVSDDEHKKILSDLGIITDNYDVRTKFEEIREFYDLVCQELNVTNIKV